jgi:hypothetical protein
VPVESVALHGIIFGASVAGMLLVIANFQVPSGGNQTLYKAIMLKLMKPFVFSAVFSMTLFVAGLAMTNTAEVSALLNVILLVLGVVLIVIYLLVGFAVIYKIFPHRHIIAPQAQGTSIEKMTTFVNALDIKDTMKQILASIYGVYSKCEDQRQRKEVASFFVETLFSSLQPKILFG